VIDPARFAKKRQLISNTHKGVSAL
jgi:hypothetical protein